MQTFESKIEFATCVMCHRYTSKGHTLILFHDGKDEVRICNLCDNEG